jgi:hypothetical protein
MEDASRWNFTVRLPRAVQRKLKVWGYENGIELQEMGEEMLQEWAKKRGVKLPPFSEKPEKAE